MVYQFDFEKKHTPEKLKEEAERILSKYPNRIPVIVERNRDSKDTPDIDKKNFLVPDDLTIGQFMFIIRKRIKINEEQAIYMFTREGHFVPTNQFMKEVYKQYQSPEKFLYFIYSVESTFGHH